MHITFSHKYLESFECVNFEKYLEDINELNIYSTNLHPSEQLKELLVQKELIDEYGNCTEKLKQIPLPHLTSDFVSNLKKFLNAVRTINFDNHPLIQYSLNSILKYLYNYSFKYTQEINLVGGALLFLLGKDYFLKALEILEISDNYLSNEFILKINSFPSDTDVRYQMPYASAIHLKQMSDYLINLFCNKSPYHLDPSIKNFIKNNAFFKYKHVNQEDIHYFINTIKDNFVTEILFTQKLSRSYLFTCDAFQMDLLPFFDPLKTLSLKTSLNSLWTPILHRILGVIDTHDFESLDHFAFLTYVSHMMKGSVCLKKEVEVGIINSFKKFYLSNGNVNINSLVFNIDKLILNHFEDKSSVKIVYYINCLLLLNKYLTDQEFFNLRNEIARYINTKYPNSTHPLIYFLKLPSISIMHLKNSLFLISILLKNSPNIFIRKHCNKDLIQLSFLNNSIYLIFDIDSQSVKNFSSFSTEINMHSDYFFREFLSLFNDQNNFSADLVLENNEKIILQNLILQLIDKKNIFPLNAALKLLKIISFKDEIFLFELIKKIADIFSLIPLNQQKNLILLLCKCLELSVPKNFMNEEKENYLLEFSLILATNNDPKLNSLSWHIFPKDHNSSVYFERLIQYNYSFCISLLLKNPLFLHQHLNFFDVIFSKLIQENQWAFQDIIEDLLQSSLIYWIKENSHKNIIQVTDYIKNIFLNPNYHKSDKTKEIIHLILSNDCPLEPWVMYFELSFLNKDIEDALFEKCLLEWKIYESKFNNFKKSLGDPSQNFLIESEQGNTQEISFNFKSEYNKFLLKLAQFPNFNWHDLNKILMSISLPILTNQEKKIYNQCYQNCIKTIFFDHLEEEQLAIVKENKPSFIQDKNISLIYDLILFRKELEEIKEINQDHIKKFIKIRENTFSDNQNIHLKKCYLLLLSSISIRNKVQLFNYSECICNDHCAKLLPISLENNFSIYLIFLTEFYEFHSKNTIPINQKHLLFFINLLTTCTTIESNTTLLWDKILALCSLLIEKREIPSKELKEALIKHHNTILVFFQNHEEINLILNLLKVFDWFHLKNYSHDIFTTSISLYLKSNFKKNIVDLHLNTISNFIQDSSINTKNLKIVYWLAKLYAEKNNTHGKAFLFTQKWVQSSEKLKIKIPSEKLIFLLNQLYNDSNAEEIIPLLIQLNPLELIDFWKKIINDYINKKLYNPLGKHFIFLNEKLGQNLFKENFYSEYCLTLKTLSKSKNQTCLELSLQLLRIIDESFFEINFLKFISRISALSNKNLKKTMWNHYEKVIHKLIDFHEINKKNLVISLFEFASSFDHKLAYDFLIDHSLFNLEFFEKNFTFEEINEFHFNLSLTIVKKINIANEIKDEKYILFIKEHIVKFGTTIGAEKFYNFIHLCINKFIDSKNSNTFLLVCKLIHAVYDLDENISEKHTQYIYKILQNFELFLSDKNAEITSFVTKSLKLILKKSHFFNVDQVVSILNKNTHNESHFLFILLLTEVLKNQNLLMKVKDKSLYLSILHKIMQKEIQPFQIYLLNHNSFFEFIGKKEFGSFWIDYLKMFLNLQLDVKHRNIFFEKINRVFLINYQKLFTSSKQFEATTLFFKSLIKVCDHVDYYSHFYEVLEMFFNAIISCSLESTELASFGILWDNSLPLPISLGNTDNVSLFVNYYGYVFLLLKTMDESTINETEFLLISDYLSSMIIKKTLENDATLFKFHGEENLVSNYITNTKYHVSEKTFIFHQALCNTIYELAEQKNFFNQKDTLLPVRGIANPESIDEISSNNNFRTEFQLYIRSLLTNPSEIRILLAIKIIKLTENNFLNSSPPFRKLFFEKILNYFYENPFYDNTNSFCYAHIIDILFKDEILGRNNGTENVSIEIFNKLFQDLTSFKIGNFKEKDLITSRCFYLLKCLNLAISNKILPSRILSDKISIYTVELKKYLILTTNFTGLENYIKEFLNSITNPSFYSSEDIALNRKAALIFLRQLLEFCSTEMEDKTKDLQVLLKGYIKQIDTIN